MVFLLAWLVWVCELEIRVAVGFTRLGDGAVGKLGSGNLLPWKLITGEVVTVEKSPMIWFSLVVVIELLVD